MVNHIAESRPLTKLADDCFLSLHSAEDNTVIPLRNVLVKAAFKRNYLPKLLPVSGTETITFNPFNASCSKLLLLKGFSAILV